MDSEDIILYNRTISSTLFIDDDVNQHSATLTSTLSFTDLIYSIDQPKKKANRRSNERIGTFGSSFVTTDSTKIILNGISGVARQGEVLAVLGPSGSGKSTLIDALANKIDRQSLQGSIAFNDELLDERDTLKSISAYVKQDDLLYPMLTVEETLMFSAELRLPRSVSKRRKKERVGELIDQLGLGLAKSTIVGDEGTRGVSGGERRRVSIGVDIVHDPILLFLDEPTTGLDSTSAFMVIQALQHIAQRGSIVIMSIHQPSTRILNLIDKVLFLSYGNTIYYGPPAKISVFFFKFGTQIPERQNLAEFVLDLIQELNLTTEGIERLIMFNKLWLRKQNETYQSCTSIGMRRPAVKNSFALDSTQKFANPWWVEVWILTKRSFVITKRTPRLLLTPFGAVILTGMIFVTLFWNLDKSSEGAIERLAFFNVAMTTMFSICLDALPIFIQERYIFMRETANNTYRRSSYVLSRSITGFLPLIVLALTFALITFFAISLRRDFSGLVFFVAIILATLWAGSGFALLFSGFVSNLVSGFTILVAITDYFGYFNGFYITRKRIPIYWLWFHYVSLLKYPYEAVIQSEFSDSDICFVKGVQMFDNTPVEPFSYDIKANLLRGISEMLGTNLTSSTCIMNGPDLVRQYAEHDVSRSECLVILIVWGFVFRVIFYFALLAGSKNKRM